MKLNRKYLVAVALLAVLAVVFGLAGTVAPVAEMPQQSSSDSVTHFTNPPTYDSGWVNITDKVGQSFTLTHDLNTTEALVDVVGRQGLTSGDHKMFFGTTTKEDVKEEWNQTYGGADQDYGQSVVQTSDGGYAMAGYTNSFGAGSNDGWLVKTDQAGNVQWNETYGGGYGDGAMSVVQTGDGGYALAGFTESYGVVDAEFWLVKTSDDGTEEWSRTYAGAGGEGGWGDQAHSVVQTSDGGYALAGNTWRPDPSMAGNDDTWLVKTDSNGNAQWNRTWGHFLWEDQAHSVVQTSDGGYAIAGHTAWFGAEGIDFWLIRTDSAGNVQWNKTYGGASWDSAWRIVQTSDGGYAMAGVTYSSVATGYDFWLVKTDAAGNMQWNQTYGGTDEDCAHSVVQTSDGGYAMAGYTYSFGAGYRDFYVVKTDASGNMQWNQTLGGANSEEASSVVQTSDGGYAMAGYTISFGAGSIDGWLVKIQVTKFGFSIGLSMTDFANSTITLYRGSTDPYWNYVRVRIWTIQEPTWQFGDINQDGVVDAQDLLILSQNYGKTLSLLSLMGIIGILGVQTHKTRKRPK